MVSRVLSCFVVTASLMFVGVAQKPAEAAQAPEQPVVQIVDLVVDSVDLDAGIANVIVTLDILGEIVERTVEVPLSLSVSEQGAECPILHLELGPIFLDVLGLVVELHDCEGGPVIVDITAVPSGGLLGDLLCGLELDLGDLLGLLDGDQLAGLEDAIAEALQAVLDQFLLDADQTVGGQHPGPPAQAGQQGPPAHAPAHGRRAGAGPPDHAPAHGRRAQDAPEPPDNDNDNDVNDVPERCDILMLEINEITLGLAGLVVETSDICLEVYAEAGPGNLLGNLLCAVVHLLDTPGDHISRLRALLALVDAIRDAIGLVETLEGLLALDA